jgi:hypothetical protein
MSRCHARARRRSDRSHELTPAKRGRVGLVRLVRLYRRKQQEARELLREQEEKWTAILTRQEEELQRVRRTIAVTQPQPAPPSRQPADVPERGDVPAAPRGLSVAEQQAVELGHGGPCWWEDSREKRARDEARRRARFIHR